MGKYEEALERARQGLPMDEVFPELSMSEDERIRKGLIHYILYEAGNRLDEETEHAFISWLEKQKEPLTPEERMNHPLYLEGFDAGRQVGEAVSQPAEWSEDGGCSEKPNDLLSEPETDLEKAARDVYGSWMAGTMDDVRRDMIELGKVLNARKEE